MKKIVINKCYGGFSISEKAAKYMAARGDRRAKKELEETAAHKDKFYGYGYVEGFEGQYERDNPLLVEAVEALGTEANGWAADLKVVEIPENVEWEIDNYDGLEQVEEKHAIWG